MNSGSRSSKGFSNVELAGVAIAVLLAIALLWKLYDYAEGVGYDRAEREVAEERNAQLVEANATIVRLQNERAARERQHALDVAAIDLAGQQKMTEVTRAKDRFVADVVAGRIRLLDPGRSPCAPRGGDPGRTALAGAGMGDGAGGGELSAEAGRFLLEEAAHADQVVVKLQACQAIVAADRR